MTELDADNHANHSLHIGYTAAGQSSCQAVHTMSHLVRVATIQIAAARSIVTDMLTLSIAIAL